MYFPKAVNKMLITWFGCGLVPVAPGTAGSIGALPLCWLAAQNFSIPLQVVFALGVTALAILGSAQDQIGNANKDPQYIVVDEVAGMLWATIGAAPAWLPMLFCFGLFRLFDVVKPFPANLFDRASKTSTTTMRRGAFIVLDDVVAGLYVLLINQGWILYSSHYASH